MGSPTGVDLECDAVDPDSSVELVTKQKTSQDLCRRPYTYVRSSSSTLRQISRCQACSQECSRQVDTGGLAAKTQPASRYKAGSPARCSAHSVFYAYVRSDFEIQLQRYEKMPSIAQCMSFVFRDTDRSIIRCVCFLDPRSEARQAH